MEFTIVSKIENDYQVWTVELPEDFFDEHINEGSSIRCRKEELLAELQNTIK